MEHRISLLDNAEKSKLFEIAETYNSMHAKDPLKWAFYDFEDNSESRTTYFALLKEFTCVIENVEDCLEDAEHCGLEYCTEPTKTAQEIASFLGSGKFRTFMKSYMMGAMWQITNLIDEGNYNYTDKSQLGWTLCKTTYDKHSIQVHSDKPISRLHESIMDFKDELDSSLFE